MPPFNDYPGPPPLVNTQQTAHVVVVAHDAANALKEGRGALPQPRCLLGVDVKQVKERLVALGRGATARHQQLPLAVNLMGFWFFGGKTDVKEEEGGQVGSE